MDERIYLYLVPVIFFILIYFGRSNKYILAKKGIEYNTKYLNKPGDEALFNEATKNDELKIFNPRKIILYPPILILGCGMLVFGVLSLYESFFMGINSFLMFGIISTILGLGVPFLFLFEDKRILKEAIRRNQFIDSAKKRWLISKISYLVMIFVAAIISFLIMNYNPNILESGSIYSNGKLTYAGTGFHPGIVRCFESSVPYWTSQNCSVFVYKINTNDLRKVLDTKIRNKIFEVQGVNVSEYGLDLCLINKNLNLSYNKILLSSIGSQKTVTLSTSCRVGSFDYSESDLPLIKEYCPNYQNCYGYQKTCCIGIFN